MSTSEIENSIINMVKEKRFLWDIRHPEYKNINLKNDEFESIGFKFNLTGDEVRRKWRSLRSGFRRELLARSNRKPNKKKKEWKNFNKLLFLRECESGRDSFSDNEIEESQNNNTLCTVNYSDNMSTDDFSDLMQLNSPVTNLSVEAIENGEIKLNIIPSNNEKQDKNCQEVTDNTQFKILPPNLNTNLSQQIYFLKAPNGVSDISPLLLIKKSDQNTSITEETSVQQNTKTTNPTVSVTNRTNEILLNSFKNVPKNKKKKIDETESDLDANDHFGRMIAFLLKEIDPEERKVVWLKILDLIINWKQKKTYLNEK